MLDDYPSALLLDATIRYALERLQRGVPDGGLEVPEGELEVPGGLHEVPGGQPGTQEGER